MMPRMVKIGTPNLTGRTRIRRSDYKIKIDWSDPNNPEIDRDSFRLDCSDSWPSGSRIFIDANYRRNWHRIDLGTKAKMNLPEDLILHSIGQNPVTLHIRVAHPEERNILIARSAPIRLLPDKEKPRDLPQGNRELLQFDVRELEAGIPTQIEFPSTIGGPIVIGINRECPQLYYALEEEIPQFLAFIIPPYLNTIIHRLVSDLMKNNFDPNDPGNHKESPWQNQWNHLLSSWAGRGLQEIDHNDDSEITNWIDYIVRHWSILSGDPALDINRSFSQGGI